MQNKYTFGNYNLSRLSIFLFVFIIGVLDVSFFIILAMLFVYPDYPLLNRTIIGIVTCSFLAISLFLIDVYLKNTINNRKIREIELNDNYFIYREKGKKISVPYAEITKIRLMASKIMLFARIYSSQLNISIDSLALEMKSNIGLKDIFSPAYSKFQEVIETLGREGDSP